MRIVVLMGVAALLSACAMGPDYSRPDIPVTDSFRMAGEGERSAIARRHALVGTLSR